MKQSIVLKNTNDVAELVAILAVAGYKVWVEHFKPDRYKLGADHARVYYEEVLAYDVFPSQKMEVQP